MSNTFKRNLGFFIKFHLDKKTVVRLAGKSYISTVREVSKEIKKSWPECRIIYIRNLVLIFHKENLAEVTDIIDYYSREATIQFTKAKIAKNSLRKIKALWVEEENLN